MPKPILQAMVLAEHIYQDGTTGKFVIAGTFASVAFQRPPATPPPAAGQQQTMPLSRVEQMGSPYLYLAMSEIYGEIPIAIRFRHSEDTANVFEINLQIGSKNPAFIAEYKVPLPPLPVSKEGAYSLDLLYQNEVLGSWRVNVVDATPKPPPA